MSRFAKILITLPVLYILIAPFFMYASLRSQFCSGIVINLTDSSDYHFVTKRQLLSLLNGNSGRILGKPVKEISVLDMENRINVLRELKVAEVYTTVDGKIYVYADQRNPVLRVMPDDGGDFFLDEDGVLVRKRNLYNPRLHIMGGNITITRSMLDGVSVLDTTIKRSVLKDIFPFINYVNDDRFWSAQIDQIYVDGNDEIDIIPRVGNNKIHLGTLENYEGKLRNLAAFYDQVLPDVGWNKYSLINLEYKDQIVCKKR